MAGRPGWAHDRHPHRVGPRRAFAAVGFTGLEQLLTCQREATAGVAWSPARTSCAMEAKNLLNPVAHPFPETVPGLPLRHCDEWGACGWMRNIQQHNDSRAKSEGIIPRVPEPTSGAVSALSVGSDGRPKRHCNTRPESLGARKPAFQDSSL